MKNQNVEKVAQLVQETKGKFFNVEFYKADGTIRKMNCRIGVKKGLKGGVTTYTGNDKKDGDITIGVAEKGNSELRRSFKASKVISLTINGETITF